MPTSKQEPSRPTNHSFRTPSTAQLDQLLKLTAEAPEMHDLHDVLVIVSSTGIRVIKLRDLRWADVDFPCRELSVPTKACCIRQIPPEPRELDINGEPGLFARCIDESWERKAQISLAPAPPPLPQELCSSLP